MIRGPRTPLGRTKRVKPRNAARRNREWVRAYGSAERVAFVASLPCAACGRVPSENAHSGTGGMGRKGDASTILPLCPDHHRLSHTMGVRSFAALFSLDLAACAERTARAWELAQEDAA